MREALIQAELELGISRETTLLKMKASEADLPEVMGLDPLITPGLEREFIDFLKNIFRQIDGSPALRNYIDEQVCKRARHN
jgi:hypothetical protein